MACKARLSAPERRTGTLLSLKGQRLSARAIDLTLRSLGQRADVTLSAHTLRHTCLTRLVRAGNDIVLVAELAGHARLETTRRYSLPSDADRQAAMDGLTVDYRPATRQLCLTEDPAQLLLTPRYGLPDLDAGALRLAEPRALTQAVSAWLYEHHTNGRPTFDGVHFQSRHGDDLDLLAVFERSTDHDTSSLIADCRDEDLHPDHPELRRALTVHHLQWSGHLD